MLSHPDSSKPSDLPGRKAAHVHTIPLPSSWLKSAHKRTLQADMGYVLTAARPSVPQVFTTAPVRLVTVARRLKAIRGIIKTRPRKVRRADLG